MGLDIIIDLIAILVIAVYIWRSYTVGFVRSLILFLGKIASLIVSYYFGKILALGAYTMFIASKIEEIAVSVATKISTETAPAYVLDTILEQIPESIEETTLSFLGGRENAVSFITEQMSGTYTPINELVTNVLKSLSIFLLQAVFCTILFIICMFIVNIVAKIVGAVFKLPIVGPINSILGGVLGLLQAIIILSIVGFIVNAGVMYLADDTSTINDSLMQSTFVFKHFYNLLANANSLVN